MDLCELCVFMSTVCVKFHSEKVLMLRDCVLNGNSRPNLTSNVMFRTRRNQTDLEEIKCWSGNIFKAACGWVCEIVNFNFIFFFSNVNCGVFTV